MGSAQVIRAPGAGYLDCVHVAPKARVGLGDPLFDWIPENGGGAVVTYMSLEFGTVGFYEEGDALLPDNDTLERAAVHVKKGQPVLYITPRLNGREAGSARGLTPRPGRPVARRRAREAGHEI